jgi:hypothetical protein
VGGRQRIAVVALCAFAGLVESASASAAVQAQPSYFRCVKDRGGAYTEAGCATRAGSGVRGEFERESAVGVGYTSNTQRVLLSIPGLETNGKLANVTCKQTKDVGSVLAPNLAEDVITFQMCEIPEQSIKYCTSAGRPLGAVETNPLDAELVESSPAKIASRFTAQDAAGGVLVEFTCGHTMFRVEGSTVGEITSPEPEHASRKWTLLFEGQSDLEAEVSSNSGATWTGPFACELRTVVTDKYRQSAKLGVEL